MAGGYECERDGCTRAVNWLLTRISPAGTISSCDDDAAPFMIGLLATELGVDGGRLYDAIKRFVDKEAKAAAKAAADAYDAAAHESEVDESEADHEPAGVSEAVAANAALTARLAQLGGGDDE